MALTRVAHLVRRAAQDTGVFDALRNNPERLRANFDLSAEHLDALHSAAALPLPTAGATVGKSALKPRVVTANRSANAIIVQDDDELLPPEGSGQFIGVAGPIVPGAPQVPIASPTANPPQSRQPPSPVTPVSNPSPAPVPSPRAAPSNPQPAPISAPLKPPTAPAPSLSPVPPPSVGPVPVPVRKPIPSTSPVYSPISIPPVMVPIQYPAPLRSLPPTPCDSPPPVAPAIPALCPRHSHNGCCCGTVALASIASTTALSAVTAITAIVGMASRVR